MVVVVAVECVVAEAVAGWAAVACVAAGGSAVGCAVADSAVVVSVGAVFAVASAGFVVGSTAAASDSAFRISPPIRFSTEGMIPSGTTLILLLTGIPTPPRMAEAAMDRAALP